MLVERLAAWLAGTSRSRPRAKYLGWEAWQRIQRRDWSGARFFAQAAIASDPSWPDGYRMLSYAHRGAKHPAEARSALRRGIAAAPEDFRLLMDLADLERGGRQFADAAVLYRRALAVEPDNVEALWKLGRALEGENALEEAERLLRRARDLEPSELNVVKALGDVLTERGAYAEALPLLEQVVMREPDNAFKYFYYAVALARTGHHDQARAAAKKAVALDPHTPRYQDLLSRLDRGG